MLKITLPSAGDGSFEEYGYVLLITIWIPLQCYLTGLIVVQAQRGKTFTEEYLNKNYLNEHAKAFPLETKLRRQGYPDMGCGFYSSKLSYKQWFEFNLAQRVHMNFLEQLLIVVFLIPVAGLKHPAWTFYLGAAYSFGRILNAIGYSKSVNGRLPGVFILNTSILGLFGLATHSMVALQ